MKRRPLCLRIVSLLLALVGGVPQVTLAQAKDEALDSQGQAILRAASERAKDQIAVFLVGFAASDTTSASETNQQATVVSLTNIGEKTSCPVSVDWWFGLDATLACTSTSTLDAGTTASDFVGTTHDHCTRDLPEASVLCNAVCDPPLTFYEGKAVVSTTQECVKRIAIDARLYHTIGDDDEVTGIANVKVVRLPSGNEED